MQIIDVSRPLAADLAPWPGDTPFDYALVGRLAEGSSVNLGRMTTSVHSGTHCDGFFHFEDRGLTIDQFGPERYLGPAVVIDLTRKFAGFGRESLGEITIDDLQSSAAALERAPRLLI